MQLLMESQIYTNTLDGLHRWDTYKVSVGHDKERRPI